jgi:UDP-galactopyranose mutase
MPGAIFAGRLADYRYYNMDQAVARALAVYKQLGAEACRAA